MKNKVKKIITTTLILAAVAVPNIVSAAGEHITGGIGKTSDSRTHYAWADYSYHTVFAYLRKYDVETRRSAWQNVSTNKLTVHRACSIYAEWGYDDIVRGSANSYQS